MSRAVSFEVRCRTPGAYPQAVRDKIERVLQRTTSPTAALVFCSGEAARLLPAIATEVAKIAPHSFLALVTSGPGVLTERGEFEGEAAVTGIVLSTPAPQLRRLTESPPSESGLAGLFAPLNGRYVPTLLFARSENFEPDQLWQARQREANPIAFGAGTLGSPGLLAIEDGAVSSADAAALLLPGTSPQIRTFHACQLLSQLLPITKTEGSLVLELDHRPALDVLEELGSTLTGRPLLFTILAEDQTGVGVVPYAAGTSGRVLAPQPLATSPSLFAPTESASTELLVRGIHGVDPERKGLLVSQEAQEGRFMTFGIRDSKAAKQTLGALGRSLSRELAGAAPQFGLYFNCSGRGQGLHGSPHVDVRLLREHFPNTPLAGFQSAFEIAPYAHAPALQLYTGVLSLFCSPS